MAPGGAASWQAGMASPPVETGDSARKRAEHPEGCEASARADLAPEGTYQPRGSGASPAQPEGRTAAARNRGD